MTTIEWLGANSRTNSRGLRPFSPYDSLWHYKVQHRLNRAWQTAPRIPFDNQSRFLFLSDSHRGDGSGNDLFMRNKPLFLQVLSRYAQAGYTYIEVGDGDDLWQTPGFATIRRAHSAVFDILHRLHQQNRLYLILGNHDMPHGSPPPDKDGLPLHEELVLQHTQTGQEMLILHGHQADFSGSRFTFFSRLAVRHIWKHWQHLGETAVSNPHTRLIQKIYQWSHRNGLCLEQQLMTWVQQSRHMLICGHTHLPRFATYPHNPYFNTGNCVNRGYLTGLEIQNGEITAVQWCPSHSPQPEPLAPTKKLSSFTPA